MNPKDPNMIDPGPSTISCHEFQENLPDLFASGNTSVPEDPKLLAHLNSCENCSALVRDLQYIADQARLLLEPLEDEPSPAVWNNIQNKLRDPSPDDRSDPLRR